VNATATLLLALTSVVAVLDWLAVGSERRAAEYLLKPLTMLGLIAVALTLDTSNSAARVTVVVALALSLIGDVFLMVSKDLFVAGLAAFLGGHAAYVVAMLLVGAWGPGLVAGPVVVLVALALVGLRIVRSAAESDPALRTPVALYMGVISAMVVTAFGVGAILVVLGALLFFVSDAVLGWTRFVVDFSRSRVVVMTTYHLGQALLVLGLVVAA